MLKVNGNEVASGVVPVSAPLLFTANDCLDFGIDLGSPVGIEYYEWVDGGFLVLRLAKRGAASWQDGGE